MMKALRITLSVVETYVLNGKSLLKKILGKWLPLNNILLEALVTHLPSPLQAQKYRTDILYSGPQDDVTAESMRTCDVKGPLLLYVFRMLPASDPGRFYALGRVFSGTISSGQTVRILGPNHLRDTLGYNLSDQERDVTIKPVQQVFLPGDRTPIPVESVGAGNFCLISGVDNYVVKEASLTTDADSYPFVSLVPEKPTSPVRYRVEPQNPIDLPKLIEGLKYLQKYEMMIKVFMEDTGELIVACENELLLEISLRDMEEQFLLRGKIKVSGPSITYKETVIAHSSQVCMSKSPNKHNRLYVKAEPLEEGFAEAIEKRIINTFDISKGSNSRLVHDWGWKEEDVKNVWCFGNPESAANILVNTSNSVSDISEIKDAICTAFQWITKEGPLAQEGVQGVRMNLVDATLHSDAVHRGSGQIIPTARRAFFAAVLTAQPRLMEPIMSVEILCPQSALGGVYNVLDKRKGVVVEEIPKFGTPLVTIKAFLAVEETHNFTSDLRASTQGQAFPQMQFDHYQVIPEDPLVNGTRANDIVKNIRKQKGLPENFPGLETYLDLL